MTETQDIIDHINGYWNEPTHTSGLQGFINALTGRQSVDTPFGEASIVTDGHRLGVIGHHVWIVKVGETTLRIKVPYELNDTDGIPWGEADISEMEDFPVERFPEYPVTLRTSSMLIIPKPETN